MNKSHDQPIARVEFAVTGRKFVPDEITAILAMPPTRSFAKGDMGSKRDGERKRPWSLWALEFEGTEVQDVAAHLLEALEGKEEALRKVADIPEVEVSIAIWWETPGGYGGFTVSSATFAQLCALSTQIHVYLPGARLP
jgi:hypothetical protein